MICITICCIKEKNIIQPLLQIPPLCVPNHFVLRCSLRFQHKNDVWFVFTSSCLLKGLFFYLHCLCLLAHSGVQSILCFVLLCLHLCFQCPFLIAPSVFSKVYFLSIPHFLAKSSLSIFNYDELEKIEKVCCLNLMWRTLSWVRPKIILFRSMFLMFIS